MEVGGRAPGRQEHPWSRAGTQRAPAARNGQGNAVSRWGMQRPLRRGRTQGRSRRACNHGGSFATGQGFAFHNKHVPDVSPPPCRAQSAEGGLAPRRGSALWCPQLGPSTLPAHPVAPVRRALRINCGSARVALDRSPPEVMQKEVLKWGERCLWTQVIVRKLRSIYILKKK